MKEEVKVILQSIISRNPEIIHSMMDDEVVMMSVNQGLFFGIDAIGTHIWNLLETPTRVEDLIEKLVAHFTVDWAVCENDTLVFLNDMLTKKVILIEEVK
jgi:Coenzyme PQQ synthesis protein D (PqqD)